MSDTDQFCRYQEVLQHMDAQVVGQAGAEPLFSPDLSAMDDFADAVCYAEQNLQNVLAVQRSYNEIVKMIM